MPKNVLTQEQKERYYARSNKKRREKRAQMSPFEKEEYNSKRREKRHNMSPEERAQWLKHRSDVYQQKLADETSHVKIATYGREYNRMRWANRTPEQKLAEKERLRLKRLAFTPEQVEKEREKGREKNRLLKELVINHYSHGKNRCMSPTCEVPGGAKDIDVLNIDHINGGGRRHMAEIKANGFGGTLYAWLRRNNFPDGFQVLCYNCNNKKRIVNKENNHATTPTFVKGKFFTPKSLRKIKYVNNQLGEKESYDYSI